MAAGDYFSLETIEGRAQNLLTSFLRANPELFYPPVPIEMLVEKFLKLKLLWEPLDEPEDEVVLAKIKPEERQIVLNENRLDMFEETEFLYNSVLAHEAGHWDLHCKDLPHLKTGFLPGLEQMGRVPTRVSYSAWDEKNAHRFAGCLLAPRDWLMAYVREHPIVTLADVYRLRDRLQMTVTAVRIRLEELDLAYIDSDGRCYPSRNVFDGQGVFF